VWCGLAFNHAFAGQQVTFVSCLASTAGILSDMTHMAVLCKQHDCSPLLHSPVMVPHKQLTACELLLPRVLPCCVGAGAASLYVPRYIAEVSPPALRGWLGSFNQVCWCQLSEGVLWFGTHCVREVVVSVGLGVCGLAHRWWCQLSEGVECYEMQAPGVSAYVNRENSSKPYTEPAQRESQSTRAVSKAVAVSVGLTFTCLLVSSLNHVCWCQLVSVGMKVLVGMGHTGTWGVCICVSRACVNLCMLISSLD
jgi:hypothetical protein